MENKTSKKIKLMIAAVLVLFLAMAAMDIFPAGIESFKRGFRAGQSEANGWLAGGDSVRVHHFWLHVIPLDPEAKLQRMAGGAELVTLETEVELSMPAPSGAGFGWTTAAGLLLSLVMTAAMLAFIVHLIVFTVGFPRRRILAHENIVSMRWIAASLGVMGLAGFGIELINFLWLSSHASLEGYRITLSPPPSVLIVALILVVLTEILNLAGRLQREQELTI